MKKTFLISYLLIAGFSILLCCCSKSKTTGNTAEESYEDTNVNPNFERDYFLCPYWFEYIECDYQIALNLYRNLNNRDKTKSFSVYTSSNGNKRLEARFSFDKGLLTKWESFPSKGDDSTYTYIYDEKGRLITRHYLNESGYIVDTRNYSYSYEDDKLICKYIDSYYGEIVYTEEIVDNSFHITKTIKNDDPEHYYLEFNNNKLQKFTNIYNIISTEYKDEYFFTYNDKSIRVKTYCDDELNRQQEWNRNGDTVNYYAYYGENLETGKDVRKEIFKDFDKYYNWLTNIEDDGTIYVREFEYIE